MSKIQMLILPVNNALLTASWQTAAYRRRFGFEHYGADMVSADGERRVYSCGNGVVLGAGFDNILGNCAVLHLEPARSRTGQEAALICRIFHLATCAVTAGRKVTKDTVLGNYGNTGLYSAGAHLHIELDRDIAYPFHTPTLTGKSTFFYGTNCGATAATMENPLAWLHQKPTPPDRQQYRTAADAYIRDEDRVIAVWR